MQESKEFLRPNHQQWKTLQAFLSLLEFISTKQSQEKGFYVGTQTPLFNYEVDPLLPLLPAPPPPPPSLLLKLITKAQPQGSYIPSPIHLCTYQVNWSLPYTEKTTLIQFVQLWLLHPEYSII